MTAVLDLLRTGTVELQGQSSAATLVRHPP